MQYDLEERCAKFGEDAIIFCKIINSNEIIRPLVSQLIRSATSVGVNYMEANQASSRKDFKNKIRICQKEANESKHWSRMIAVAEASHKQQCQKLWQKTHQLTLIFAKISKSCAEKDN